MRPDTQRIEDILDAIGRACEYRRHLAAHDEQAGMAYDAILRNLGVIGESATHLSASVTAEMDQPWASIRGLRNIVIHEYFAVDPGIVTDILDSYLVPLASSLTEYLAAHGVPGEPATESD